MPSSNRRHFVLRLVAGSSVLAAPALQAAEEKKPRSTVKLTETEAYPRSMGFKFDTTQVDAKRYPRHDAATQECSKCQLYSGEPGEEWGPCSFYGGRLVPVKGWCRNFKVRKAAA